jgi:septum formation protein
MAKKIILASQSPRRKQLLEWAEVDFEVMVSNTDETYPSNLNFSETAIHIAQNKALAIIHIYNPEIPVLAADTIVVCNNEIIGKPINKEDAIL